MSLARQALLLSMLGAVGCAPGPIAEPNSDDSTSEAASSSSGDESESDAGDADESEVTSDPLPGFAIEPDQPFYCDPWAQDCQEGEKCVPFASSGGSWDSYTCVPVVGDHGPGEPCIYGGASTPTDDCDAASACWDVVLVDDELIGTCVPLCQGSEREPECPIGSSCLISDSGSIPLCVHTCHPLAQDCWLEGLACVWVSENFGCVWPSDEPAPPGGPCSLFNECAIGASCLDGTCAPFCDLALGDAQCEVLPGTSCVAMFEPGAAPPGYDNVGVCLVP